MKKLVALVIAAVFSLSLGIVYAENETQMPWENLSKGATTKEKSENKNKGKEKKGIKIAKAKKKDNDKDKKKVVETAK